MKHPIRRRLMSLGFQGLRQGAQWLPLGASRAFGRALGWLAFVLLRSQRRLTQTHLAFALGDSLSAAQRRRVAGRVFENLGQNIM